MAQDPPPQQPEQIKQPSPLYRLARRLSGKTTVIIPEHPSKEAQEAMEMPPPELPKSKPQGAPSIDPSREQESGASSYASVEEPEEADTSSSKRRRSWASITSSAGSDDEQPALTKPLVLNTDEKTMQKGQSIDPRLCQSSIMLNETHRDQAFKRPKDSLPAW